MNIKEALLTPRGNSDTAQMRIDTEQMSVARKAINTPVAEFAKAALMAAGVYGVSTLLGYSPDDAKLFGGVFGGLYGLGRGGIKFFDNLPKPSKNKKNKSDDTDPTILDDIDL
jgi:hypothetical protein